jgi:hypothetical protein
MDNGLTVDEAIRKLTGKVADFPRTNRLADPLRHIPKLKALL